MFKHCDEEKDDVENESVNKIFLNPSQSDQSDKVIHCQFCTFSSTTENDLTKHQGGSVCSICGFNMGCQINLRDHQIIDHKIKD